MIAVAAAVIRREGMVLLASRPADKPPAGWEFPGGKLEKGESINQALRRELREELAITAVCADCIYVLRHGNVKIWFVRTMLEPGSRIEALEHQQWKWVKLDPVPPEGLLPADLGFWKFLTGN